MTTLTRDQVVTTLGRIDDVAVAEIIASGASMPELLEAKRWVAGDQRTLGDDMRLRPAVVSKVCELLRTEETEWDPEA